MPNIATVLKDEISRLCRKEIRKQVEPYRKSSAGYRREIAALKRQVLDLQRRTNVLARRAAQTDGDPRAGAVEGPSRFVAKGLRSLRVRLGLSANELALLMSVSPQTIYNWELKKTKPGKEQLATLGSIRALGKKEAQQRLEQLQSQQPRKRK